MKKLIILENNTSETPPQDFEVIDILTKLNKQGNYLFSKPVDSWNNHDMVIWNDILYQATNMKEISSTGGGAAGEYNTKLASRKIKKQDIKSPTGFESSPNPNMYTKIMKFRVIEPKERLNSVDLWSGKKGQPKFDKFPQSKKVYTEIKVNKPNINYQFINDFLEAIEKDQNNIIYNFYPQLQQCKTISNVIGVLEDLHDSHFEAWKNVLNSIGLSRYISLTKDEFNKYYSGDGERIDEVRYSKFKKQTQKRTPQEQLHMAVKEIQMNLDKVNKLVEFTSKMKSELRESDEDMKYLNRTKRSIAKIQEKIQHISNKIKTIIE